MVMNVVQPCVDLIHSNELKCESVIHEITDLSVLTG